MKIYVRDGAGKNVENARLEVSGLSGKGKDTPTKVLPMDGAHQVMAEASGATVQGIFLLKASAEGFETYERQFSFPICEVQSFELRLRPAGSTQRAAFERLFTVHGKVFDEDKRPFGEAKIEATSADGRVYQTFSNAYGYFKFDLPKGAANIRVSNSKISDIVFDNFKVEKNYSVLNVPVCLRCNQKQSKN
ncbi:MAG TPA: carboxypeptidase-like regulatory domain-containing protein [Pyrinomonadaceae bacterium]|nr:carboxypeptidase-like regulatory domain-containing protein [Pyrinomonadaceae bacterium]